MTSADNQQYITVELFNSKMETFLTQIKLGNEQLRNELNAKIDEKFGQLNDKIDERVGQLNAKIDSVQSSLHAEIQAVAVQTQVNAAKIEMLQHTFYWGFAILAFIAAFVPLFRREREKKEQTVTRDSVLEIVNDAIAKAMRNVNIVGK